MKSTLWAFAGIIAGLALALVLVIAVEGFSAVVHPFPEDFGETVDEMCAHVALYPEWVLAAVVLAWGVTTLLAVWTAGKIGNLYSAAIVGVVLFAMVVLNLAMLPYSTWFKVVMPIAILAAIFPGVWCSRPAKVELPPVQELR
jgi:hypothetical protein